MKRKRQTKYVVVLVVSSSDAGSTPAISTLSALPLRRALSCFSQRKPISPMILSIPFTKMCGAGNDFVVIDNMKSWLKVSQSNLAKVACSRRFGVGADGLLILEPSTKADFTMRYYNADGSYGGMCGNGGRCIARFAFDKGISGSNLSFEALDYLYSAEVVESSVKLKMKPVTTFILNHLRSTVANRFSVHFIDTGSPHAVVEVPALDELDVPRLGRELRYNEAFSPDGCNVNFVKIMPGKNAIMIRTYERGVEEETLACGTGSVASAIIVSETHGLRSPVNVLVRSGELLKVCFDKMANSYHNISLEGSAYIIFDGVFAFDDVTGSISGLPIQFGVDVP